MVLIVSFVSEAVSRVFGSGDRGDQDSTTMVGSLPDRRIPSAVSRSVACAFGLLLLGAMCRYIVKMGLRGFERTCSYLKEKPGAKAHVLLNGCRTGNAGGWIGVVAS
mgnify:CR=1 FL=1